MLAYSQASEHLPVNPVTENRSDTDLLFKALADPSRRKLLDLLHAQDGQTLNELCEHLDMTRQGVTQHLACSRRRTSSPPCGAGARNCTSSIRYRCRRSTSAGCQVRKAAPQGAAGAQTTTGERPMARSTFVYVTYIRTTPEKLWSALTDDAEFMKQYWFGIHCESEWTAGSLVEDGAPRRQRHRRRRDRRGRSAAAAGDPLAASTQARAQGRRRVALHDGAGAQRTAVKLSITHTIERDPRSSSRRCRAAGRRSSPT